MNFESNNDRMIADGQAAPADRRRFLMAAGTPSLAPLYPSASRRGPALPPLNPPAPLERDMK